MGSANHFFALRRHIVDIEGKGVGCKFADIVYAQNAQAAAGVMLHIAVWQGEVAALGAGCAIALEAARRCAAGDEADIVGNGWFGIVEERHRGWARRG